VDISSAERARLQTVEEWLLEYETGKPVMPGILTKELTRPQRINHILRYESHRTTKVGHLVLAFIDIESWQEVNAFFNVGIIKKRGEYKGTSYRTGLGGQFNVTPRHKFYKFWMNVVGKEPRRWSRVHKEMKSKLGNILLTGDQSTKYRNDGSPYTYVDNLRVYGTTMAQEAHNVSTRRTLA